MSKLHNAGRDQTIEILRIIATLSVILIHTTTRILESSHFDLINTSGTLFLNQISRFAVPFFFIISGYALALSYKQSSFISYIKKRLDKLLIPFIFWSFFYYLFIYKSNQSVIQMLFEGNASYQLYFVPTLFIYYLIFPLLFTHANYLKNSKRFLTLLILEVVLLAYDYYSQPLHLVYPLRIAVLNFIFFIFGIIFSKSKEKILTVVSRLYFPLSLLIPVLGVFIYLEGKDFYEITHNYLSFYSQWRPSILLYSFILFLVLYKALQNVSSGLIEKLSKNSLFVFFIHIAILEGVWKLLEGNISGTMLFIVVSVISFVVAEIVHTNKWLTKILA